MNLDTLALTIYSSLTSQVLLGFFMLSDTYPTTQVVFKKVIKTLGCLNTKHFYSNANEGKCLLDNWPTKLQWTISECIHAWLHMVQSADMNFLTFFHNCFVNAASYIFICNLMTFVLAGIDTYGHDINKCLTAGACSTTLKLVITYSIQTCTEL